MGCLVAARQQPDHVAVTGDLTNVALEHEFERASQLLARLGTPDWVSLVPGNHDSYVAVTMERSWNLWREYMRSDSDDSEHAPNDPVSFPTLRIRGEVALVGLCSALPTPLFQATGTLGSAQLSRLGPLLAELRERELCRVVLVHHPITHKAISPRRRLTDSRALEAVLEGEGADLVLHGHRHRTMIDHTRGPDGDIPVVGVRSASDIGESEEKRAQYHLYEIERSGGSRYQVSLCSRDYDPASGGFVAGAQRKL